ncbi:hypothetical protein F4808DRAFT_24591 [Astrocystis sublimbata]|nr:hypothetical protein F4808DRAFT_24591 [Astrocystis sublimbata]
MKRSHSLIVREMPISRKKSCQQCRGAKARCTLERTCQRCLQRGLSCDYVDVTPRWEPYDSAHLRGGTAPWTTTAIQSPFTSFIDGLTPGDLEIPQGLIDTSLAGLAPADVTTYRQHNPTSHTTRGAEPLETVQQQSERSREAAVLPSPSTNDANLFFPWAPSPPPLSTVPKMDLHLIGRLSPTLATPEDCQEEGDRITVVYGRRYEQFLRPRKETNLQRALMLRVLMGQVEDFPRRLIQGSRLPPFIHPQCALDDRLPRECIAKNGSHQCFPEPLAICVSLTQLYFGRNGGNSSFVWKLIYAEQKRLYSEHHKYDGPTLLASVQAMSLYMLLQAKDHETIAQNNVAQMTVTLTEMAKRLHQHPESAPYLADIYKIPHLSQKSWAFYEGVRRCSTLFRVFGIVLNVLIGNPNLSPDCGSILTIPLLCQGYLWDTDTTENWAERLHRYERRRACQQRVLVIGDLVGLQGSTTSASGEDDNHPLSDPLLQKDLATWCDNLDELGTLVWMASSLD